MKDMFYGGCHAGILRRVFSRHAEGSHDFSVVRNFELIKSGQSFPFDALAESDAIVFSPVRRAEYSTAVIQEFCAARGIKTISYPWMQWQALYPFSKKGPFLGGTSWRYDGVFNDIAFEGVDQAAKKTTGPDLDEAIKTNFAISHNRLVDFEKEFGTDITASDYILENYKKTRLFLTPDHPTQALYSYLAREVSSRLGVKISSDFYYSGAEPQQGIKLPIMPRVSDLLDLSYRDSDFENQTAFGSSALNWREYLKLYVEPEARVMECRAPTLLKRRAVHGNEIPQFERLSCHKGTILVAKQGPISDGHLEITPVLLLPEGRAPVVPEGRWYIFNNHWTENTPGLM